MLLRLLRAVCRRPIRSTSIYLNVVEDRGSETGTPSKFASIAEPYKKIPSLYNSKKELGNDNYRTRFSKDEIDKLVVLLVIDELPLFTVVEANGGVASCNLPLCTSVKERYLKFCLRPNLSP